jgi:hypothetical protein
LTTVSLRPEAVDLDVSVPAPAGSLLSAERVASLLARALAGGATEVEMHAPAACVIPARAARDPRHRADRDRPGRPHAFDEIVDVAITSRYYSRPGGARD